MGFMGIVFLEKRMVCHLVEVVNECVAQSRHNRPCLMESEQITGYWHHIRPK